MSKAKDKTHELHRELVLSAIQTEAQRPRAIVRICKRLLNQNQVVQILNELEKEGLVKRNSTKTWIAAK
ncbi:MAG: hypothetical protein ACXQS8_05380 [Candidatus Helarchaeales archaeon]